MLQVKGQELQDDLHPGFGQNGEGAVQIVRILLWKARRFDGPIGACEVLGTIFRAYVPERGVGREWRGSGEGKRCSIREQLLSAASSASGLFKCLGPYSSTHKVFVSVQVALGATHPSHLCFKPSS